MVQVSKNITMFAAVSRPRKLTYYRFVWAFFMSILRLVSLRYKAVCTLRWLHTITIVVVSLVGNERQAAFLFIQISNNMTKDFEICNAGNNSTRIATSTHDTRVSKLKPSQTTAERHSFILLFRDKYPAIRKMKIRQTGNIFIARARAGKRYLHAGAYSLRSLFIAFDNECRIKLS